EDELSRIFAEQCEGGRRCGGIFSDFAVRTLWRGNPRDPGRRPRGIGLSPRVRQRWRESQRNSRGGPGSDSTGLFEIYLSLSRRERVDRTVAGARPDPGNCAGPYDGGCRVGEIRLREAGG